MIIRIFLIGALIFVMYIGAGCAVFFFKKRRQPKSPDNVLGKIGIRQVEAHIYDTDYYLHGYSGDLSSYLSALYNLPTPLRRCFEYANPRSGEKVLDLGCGRGHLAYFCVTRGCLVTAVDYSDDAVSLALRTREELPAELKEKLRIIKTDMKDLKLEEVYDVIFMADLVEHLYDWELEILFAKVKQLLMPRIGRLIIHTAPNKLWIKYIFPVKRLLDWPSTLRKGKAILYTRDKYSYDPEMHVNEQTPATLRKLLAGFDAKVWCDDGSSNIISILTRNFAGADIWAVAKIGRQAI